MTTGGGVGRAAGWRERSAGVLHRRLPAGGQRRADGHRRASGGHRSASDFRAAFRAWRRSRPFWGGLLLLIAGFELVLLPLSGVLSHGALKLVIYIGIGGVFGILIGILLMAAGIMCWINATHRMFYGIAGIVLGILSFPASNLGGFFLGMLLAIIGGSLAFAWTKIDASPVHNQNDRAPSDRAAGLDLITGAQDDTQERQRAPREPSTETRPRDNGHRALAIAALPAVLAIGLLAAPANRVTPSSGQFCILGIICIGSSPSPAPTAGSATPASSATTAPATTTSASPCSTASSSASPSPNPSCSPSPSGGSSPGSSTTSPSPGATSSSGSTTKKKTAKVKQATADPSLVASSATSVLTAGYSTLDNFTFDGVVNMPVAGGGTVQMMKFSMSASTLGDGVTVSVTQNGTTSQTQSPTLAFSGDMTLYATKLSGKLGVIPLTFTPSTVSSVLLSISNLLTSVAPITLTNVTVDQPLATAGGLQTGALSIGF